MFEHESSSSSGSRDSVKAKAREREQLSIECRKICLPTYPTSQGPLFALLGLSLSPSHTWWVLELSWKFENWNKYMANKWLNLTKPVDDIPLNNDPRIHIVNLIPLGSGERCCCGQNLAKQIWILNINLHSIFISIKIHKTTMKNMKVSVENFVIHLQKRKRVLANWQKDLVSGCKTMCTWANRGCWSWREREMSET